MNYVPFLSQNITLTNVLLFALFGFVVGIIMHVIDSGDVRGGVLGTTLFGIAGSVVGGLVSTLVFGVNLVGFTPQGILAGLLGGLILAFVYRLLFRESGHFKTTVTNLQ